MKIKLKKSLFSIKIILIKHFILNINSYLFYKVNQKVI